MTYSKSQAKATKKWEAKNYEQIKFTAPKGFKIEIKESYKKQGYDSMRAFILDAIKEKMNATK